MPKLFNTEEYNSTRSMGRVDAADEYIWLNSDFEKLVSDIVHMVSLHQSGCPQGGGMSEEQHMALEDAFTDAIKDVLHDDIQSCMQRLREDGDCHEEMFISRVEKAHRIKQRKNAQNQIGNIMLNALEQNADHFNPATIPQMKEVEARFAKEFGGVK